MDLIWVSGVIWALFGGLSHLFLLKILHRIAVFGLFGSLLFVCLFVDSISRESIDILKIIICSILVTGLIFANLEPDAVILVIYPICQIGWSWAGLRETIGSLLAVAACVVMPYYYFKIYINAPSSLKRYSRLLLVSIIFFLGGPITAGIPITPNAKTLHNILPGIFAVFPAIGYLITTFILVKEPKLAYVLPFKALRVTIVDSNRGIALYTHTWVEGKDFVDDNLFTAALHAISMLFNESLQKGDVKEIHLSQAILIDQKNKHYPFGVVLVANKSSKALRDAISSFINKIEENFAKYFTNDPIPNLDNFEKTSILMKESFSFLPEYD